LKLASLQAASNSYFVVQIDSFFTCSLLRTPFSTTQKALGNLVGRTDFNAVAERRPENLVDRKDFGRILAMEGKICAIRQISVSRVLFGLKSVQTARISMKHDIQSASDIGLAIRTARKAQKLRQDDAAGSVGVSESFMVKVERGADAVQWGKLFQILEGLGVRVTVDIPGASPELLSDEAAKTLKRSTNWRIRADARAQRKPSAK
jgi:transcriptional regulator with XRE-family HTH domain